MGANASPRARSARNRYEQSRESTPDLTPSRIALTAAITSQLDMNAAVCRQCWGHLLAHNGSMPKKSNAVTAVERQVARRFAKLRTRAQREPAAEPGEVQRLLRRVLAESAPLKAVLRAEKSAAQKYRAFARRRHTETRQFSPRAEALGLGRVALWDLPIPMVHERGS